MAVDKSVLLHKTGNNIDKKRVFAELLDFDPSEYFETVKIEGTESRYEDFEGLNSFILTNALNEPKLQISERFDDYSDSEEESEIFFDTNFRSDHEKTEAKDLSSLRVRKKFPETWIF